MSFHALACNPVDSAFIFVTQERGTRALPLQKPAAADEARQGAGVKRMCLMSL
jgi:hypothetical protein